MAQYDKVIHPGQDGEINLELDGAKLHGGGFTKTATITSNDPKRRTMTVSVSGTVIPYLEVAPARLFMQGYYGEPVERSFTIKSNEKDKKLEITGIESSIDDKITYRVEPGVTEGTFSVRVWKNPKLAIQNTYGSLIVHTNSKI